MSYKLGDRVLLEGTVIRWSIDEKIHYDVSVYGATVEVTDDFINSLADDCEVAYAVQCGKYYVNLQPFGAPIMKTKLQEAKWFEEQDNAEKIAKSVGGQVIKLSARNLGASPEA